MKIKIWISATRPKTLPAGISPVILGLSLAYANSQRLNYTAALITLLCTLGLQISSNLINDYYDGVKGTDDSNRLGPDRATSLGLVSPGQMKKAFTVTLLSSLLLGIYLMALSGWPIVIIGISSLFFAWAYTGGPYPLSYFGLGEIFAFIFFGPIAVWGTFFIQTQTYTLPLTVCLGGAGLGLLASALMGVNNLRDTQQDRSKGKITLSTCIGINAMRKVVFILIVLSLISMTLMIQTIRPQSLLILIMPALFLIFTKLWQQVLYKSTGRELNDSLANIGKYLFLNALLASATILYLTMR